VSNLSGALAREPLMLTTAVHFVPQVTYIPAAARGRFLMLCGRGRGTLKHRGYGFLPRSPPAFVASGYVPYSCYLIGCALKGLAANEIKLKHLNFKRSARWQI